MKAGKTLHIISAFGMGGAETWLVQLVRYWSKKNDGVPNIDFVVTHGKKDHFDDEVTALGSKIYYIELKRNSLPSFTRRFRKVFSKGRYDSIHDHQDFLSGWHFMLLVGLLPKVRVVHVHNPTYQLTENYGITFKRRAQLKIGKWLISLLATHIAGTSKQVLKEYGITKNNFPKQWINSLHCAFPITAWSGNHKVHKLSLCNEIKCTENTKILLFVGRLDRSLKIDHPNNHKNSAFAIKILKACQSLGNYKLVIVGANHYAKEGFLNFVQEEGLEGQVILLGLRDDVSNLMLGADMLLFPSRAEGLGMVAVEAQAAGLPVLASTAVPKECVVITELVTFHSLENSYESWASAILDITKKSREDSTHEDIRWQESPFNIEVCAQNLERIYFGG